MTDTNTLTAVPERERLTFMPTLFGKHFMSGETLVYNFMRAYAEGYNGGFYTFYKTECGAAFLACEDQAEYSISIDTNYFSGTMSAVAAGIVATLYSLSLNACRFNCQHLSEQYHTLLDYARTHPEYSTISAAID